MNEPGWLVAFKEQIENLRRSIITNPLVKPDDSKASVCEGYLYKQGGKERNINAKQTNIEHQLNMNE